MKYAIEYLKHHKSELDKMVADGTNTEADREWWAKLSTELETAIERLASLDVSQQRELLVAYDDFQLMTLHRFSCSEECIDAFLENNSG